MRGEVEIWDGDKLLHKESNLLVNGAGELLADIMTVSPSLSGIADHATSSILDSSNYTIQAISFGKDASAYQYNAHAMNSRRNLFKWSTPSSASLDGVSLAGSIEVSSVPQITNPPGFEDVASSVAHVLQSVDRGTGNAVIKQQLMIDNAAWPDLTLSAGQDTWVCYSSYFKPCVPGYPFYRGSTADDGSMNPSVEGRSRWKLAINGTGMVINTDTDTRVGASRCETTPRYPLSGCTVSSVHVSFTTDPRNYMDEGGYSIDAWDSNNGVIPLENGWYRAYVSILSPVSGVSAIDTWHYVAGHDGLPIYGEYSGATYTFGEQLELGRWPTDLQINNGYTADNWDMSGSVLNRDHSPGTVTDNGTVRVIPPYGTSSYVPTNYLSSPPNPESTRVEDGNTDLFGLSSATSGFNMGQNLNVIPYREQKSQLPVFFDCYSTYMQEGEQQRILFDAAGANNPPSGTGSLGPQAYYLGCYPEGSSTGGSNWALVSSLDNSAAYTDTDGAGLFGDPNFVSGTYNSIINEASSMDVSGFVGKVYDPQSKVGVIADVNKLGWTDPETIENTPGITFNSDLNGTFWGVDNVGTFSAIAAINPIGGPSSFHFSGAADSTAGYCLLKSQDGASRFNDWTATGTQIASVYFKRPGNSTVAPSSVMIKIKDNTATTGNYTNYFEYLSDGLVPTLKREDNYCTTHIEDAGNDWYRIIMRVDGLADTSKTNEGDNTQFQIYLGDSIDNDVTNVRGKYMLAWGPQFEQYPLAYGLSAQPFQNVAGDTPTIAEQNGAGGLHVSGGIDATNSGTVEYSMIVGSGDVGYSNLYGGIYNMGLWTIDMNETLKAGNTPPYSFGPLNNPRKYRLFSTKHLTKNLGYIEDNGNNAGALNYSDLTIKWRLHFH